MQLDCTTFTKLLQQTIAEQSMQKRLNCIHFDKTKRSSGLDTLPLLEPQFFCFSCPTDAFTYAIDPDSQVCNLGIFETTPSII